jgi:hypothetical protein
LVNDNSLSTRGVRGGNWSSSSIVLHALIRSDGYGPNGGGSDVGFRVASIAVPEPSTLLLVATAGMSLLRRRRR